jgi:hypothetical protein
LAFPGIHDRTIDGLFLTVTGSMLSLIFSLISFGNYAIKAQTNSRRSGMPGVGWRMPWAFFT